MCRRDGRVGPMESNRLQTMLDIKNDTGMGLGFTYLLRYPYIPSGERTSTTQKG